jgi:hypothetical protein
MKIDRWNLPIALALAAVLGWTSAVLADNDNYAVWQNSRNIVMNTTASGANVATDQTNFPIAVRLAGSDFPLGAKTDGTDIRFAKSDGTHLPYQIERWDNTNSAAAIWVKADVLGNNGTQYIVMYWGNAAAGDSSSGAAVFDTANGFAGVWHLGETGNIDPQGYKDATYNGNDGTGFQTSGLDTPAVIGRGQYFVGTATPTGTGNQGLGSYIKIPDQVINVASGTISIWAQITTLPITPANADVFGSWNTNNARYYFGCDATGQLRAGYGPSKQFVTAAYKLTTNTYYYLTMAWSGTPTQATMYVNDTLRGTSSAQAVAAPTDINIGSFGAGYSDPWIGPLDECRVDNVQRSADWLKLCYESQKPGSAWISLESTSAKGAGAQKPADAFELQVNSPNRPAGLTSVRYTLPAGARVDLCIYNLQGGLVKRLVDAGNQDAGTHSLVWDGRNELNRAVANGPYICRISTPDFVKATMVNLSR